MSVPPIPEGFATITPHLCCDGCAEAIEFYKRAFGAKEVGRNPGPGGKLIHATLEIGSSKLFLCDDFPEMCAGIGASPRALGRSPVTMHLHVEDCDATTQQAEVAGAVVTMPAQDTFWGARYGRLRDPFGHEWAVATSIKEVSPQEAAEAGEQYFKG